MRSRAFLLAIAAIIFVALVVLSLADSLLVDLFWFRSIGYEKVFFTTISSQVAIFAAVWLVAFLAILVSGLVALRSSPDRERLRVVRRPDNVSEINLPELMRAFGDRIPWRTIITAASAVLAIFAAQGEAGSWDTYLKAIYGLPFGYAEKAFGHDVGFYVFTLPLLQDFGDLFLLIIFLAGAVAAGVYWARGAVDFRESPPRISTGAAAHLSVLLGLFFIQRAYGYWLGRFDLLFHTNGVVFGLRYVDSILWRPGLWLLAGLALAAAVICFTNVAER